MSKICLARMKDSVFAKLSIHFVCKCSNLSVYYEMADIASCTTDLRQHRQRSEIAGALEIAGPLGSVKVLESDGTMDSAKTFKIVRTSESAVK